MTSRGDIWERFFPKVRIEDFHGCWLWTAGTRNGYGAITVGGGRGAPLVYAHRLTYEAARGPIDAGLQVDHLCRVRRCVNPTHLEAVTQIENLRRQAAARTHCRNGHEFNPDNTTYTSSLRRCKLCRRAATRPTREKAA